jgi:hypothetical protein
MTKDRIAPETSWTAAKRRAWLGFKWATYIIGPLCAITQILLIVALVYGKTTNRSEEMMRPVVEGMFSPLAAYAVSCAWVVNPGAVIGSLAHAPKRRRFRFSMRTMIVAFTVIAVWLCWNVRVVQQRKELWASLTSQGLVETHIVARTSGVMRWVSYPPSSRGILPDLSLIRQVLGDELRPSIVYSGSDPELVHSVFPEAVIMLPAGK